MRKTAAGSGKPHTLAAGGKSCPECKVAPITMLKTPEVKDGDGNLMSGAIFETGCPICVRRSRGGTEEAATEKWNKREFVTKNGELA